MTIMKRIALLLLAFASAPALADIPSEHDVILSGDFGLSYQHITSSQSGSGSIDILRVAPSFDVVVTRGLTLGAWLVYEHFSTGDSSADDYGIIPRAGWIAQLGPSFFVWPRAGIGYIHGTADVFNIPTSSSSRSVNRVQLDVDVPFLYAPVPHFFLGGGPLLRLDLTSSVTSGGGTVSGDGEKLTAFGVNFLVGGYF
jgi:hypothetical protein